MAAAKTVRSADRALEVLEVIAESPHPRSLAELAKELGIPKSTLHALLWTLAERGWMEVEEATGRFRLGMQALVVGRSYVETDRTLTAASAVLDRLAQQTRETVHFGRLDGTSIVYLDKRESQHPLRLFSAIGRRLPAFTTALGKAILAERPEEVVDEHLPSPLVAETPASLVDRGALLADLELTRERGYAVDNEESTHGIRGFAVALRTEDPPMDAVSCAVPLTRLDPEAEAAVVEGLRQAEAEIRGLVGGPPTRRDESVRASAESRADGGGGRRVPT